MEFSFGSLFTDTWRKLKSRTPPTTKVAASIASAQVLPQPATIIPPTAAPKIIAPLENKLFTEFVFCRCSSGTSAGKTPDIAGQKIPHIKPKFILTISRTIIGTFPVAK